MIKEKKYNYFYKITNLINNHFYYGIHSTNDLNDGYMGSGSRLHYAYKEFGIENFKKEILKFFDTREECAKYEAFIVNEELITDINCYNISLGGETYNTLNTISCIDKDGNRFRCKYNDPEYINGEYKPITTGYLPVIDKKTNNKIHITVDEYNLNKQNYELIGCCNENFILVQEKNNKDKRILISKEYYNNHTDIYESINTNKVIVKDKKGNFYKVDKEDPRYISGELVFCWKNRKHTQETKEKISKHHKEIHFHQGKTNPMYGKMWVNKDNNSIVINQEELQNYIQNGWKQGRYKKINIDPEKPTLQQLNESYNNLKNWKLVATNYNMTISALKYLRKQYEKIDI